MKALKFKKVGRFIDEGSPRYEAAISTVANVRVYKDAYIENGFVFEFVTKNGHPLNSITADYRSSFWSGATKRQAIKRVQEIVNDADALTRINNHAVYILNEQK